MAGSNKGWLYRFGPTVALLIFGPFILLSKSHEYGDPVNRTRIENVKLFKNAIDRFHKDRLAYPKLLPPGSIDSLHADLVQGGYLEQIPAPVDGFQFVYMSDGTHIWGLLVLMKQEGSLLTEKIGGLCVIGHGIKGTGAWGNPPECRF
mgnify:CR=1 FL=1